MIYSRLSWQNLEGILLLELCLDIWEESNKCVDLLVRFIRERPGRRHR